MIGSIKISFLIKIHECTITMIKISFCTLRKSNNLPGTFNVQLLANHSIRKGDTEESLKRNILLVKEIFSLIAIDLWLTSDVKFIDPNSDLFEKLNFSFRTLGNAKDFFLERFMVPAFGPDRKTVYFKFPNKCCG